MPFAFKPLNLDDVSVVDSVVHKTQTLSSGSDEVFSIQFRSGSLSGSSDVLLSKSGSHWNFLSNTFYKSASRHHYNNELHRFYGNTNAAIGYSGSKQQHLNKFNISGSVLSIPQYYFGETIKKGSFIFTDNSTAKTIEIKDDGNGNLYSSNAHDSSSTTAISSSDNYAGNIFYDLGIATITETGSWSGSTAADAIKYTDALVGSYNIKFDSTQTIYTKEFSVTIKPEEFNHTMNPTVRAFASGGSQHLLTTPYMLNDFTSSLWKPYITGIQLYGEPYRDSKGTNTRVTNIDEPLIIAKLPRPVKMRDDMTMIFKIRLDM